jgi:hypothetical protein
MSGSLSVRSVEYYYATVLDRPGQAAELLTLLAGAGIELLAFSILPTGPTHTQLMLFPESPAQLIATAKRAGLELTGPQHALLVQGDNELGALVEIHRALADANINVYASSGVTDTKGGFGYVLYVRPEDFKHAATVAGVANVPSWRPEPPALKK